MACNGIPLPFIDFLLDATVLFFTELESNALLLVPLLVKAGSQ